MKLPSSVLRRCWFLAGPTACGKSATSIILADRLNAEIISLDSMAIYRGMDIGTAKPSKQDLQRVAHHLIDIAEPYQEYSVAEFVRHAARVAEEIIGRQRVPLFVGGTGLYLRSVLRGLFEGPEPDWSFRKSMEQLAIENGPQWLHDKLAACDPVTAARLHLNDMRRIIRALEVFELTGRPISEDQQHHPLSMIDRPRVVAWLEPPRDWLRARIDLRVDQMISDGWLEETRDLMKLQPPPSRTARQALGYRELIGHLNGQLTLEAAVERIKISTRQFAKRQHTWFRNLEECCLVAMTGMEAPEQIADRIQTLDDGAGSDL